MQNYSSEELPLISSHCSCHWDHSFEHIHCGIYLLFLVDKSIIHGTYIPGTKLFLINHPPTHFSWAPYHMLSPIRSFLCRYPSFLGTISYAFSLSEVILCRYPSFLGTISYAFSLYRKLIYWLPFTLFSNISLCNKFTNYSWHNLAHLNYNYRSNPK